MHRYNGRKITSFVLLFFVTVFKIKTKNALDNLDVTLVLYFPENIQYIRLKFALQIA